MSVYLDPLRVTSLDRAGFALATMSPALMDTRTLESQKSQSLAQREVEWRCVYFVRGPIVLC